MSNIELVFELLIVIITSIGLIRHSGILKGEFRKNTFIYYTNQSNLLVFIFFLGRVLIHLFNISSNILNKVFFSELSHLSVTATILTTFIIYHTLLAPSIKSKGITKGEFNHYSLDNYLVHYIVPILTLIDWVLVGNKTNLTWIDGVLWIIIPLAYMIFIYVRANIAGNIPGTNSPYPYPFMNPDKLGIKRVIINIILIALTLILLGLIMVALAKFI